MKDIIFTIQNVAIKIAAAKRSAAVIQSLKDISSDVFGFVGGYLKSRINYYNYYTNKIAISYNNFKINHPTYSKFANRVSYTLGFLFDILTSPKVWKPLVVIIAATAFALSSLGILPIMIFVCSMIGFLSATHNDVKQRVNIEKIKSEEKALRTLVQEKQKSIKLASSLGINNESLAQSIGLTSLLQRKSRFLDSSTLNNEQLRAVSASLLNIQELKKELKLTNKKYLRERHDLLKQKITETKQVAQQKNKLGYTTVGKSAMKALGSGFVETMSSLAILSLMTNPYTLTIGVSSVFANYLGSGMYRYTVSNEKQGYKNAIEAFRTRPDIPEYNNLAEIEGHAKTARLERKILKRLSNNEEFKETIAKLNSDPNNQSLIDSAKKKIETIKEELLLEAHIIKKDKEIIKLDQKIQAKIEKSQYHILKDCKNDKDLIDRLKLEASREVLKEKLTIILCDKKFSNSIKIDILRAIDRMNKCDQLPDFEKLLPEDNFKAVKSIFDHIETKQNIELLQLKKLKEYATKQAKKLVLEKTQATISRQDIINQKITKARILPQNYESLLNDYKTSDYKSYWQNYWGALKDNFNFTKPHITFDGNPHDLIINHSLTEFATFKDVAESSDMEIIKKTYQKRIDAIPNVTKPAINLDLTLGSILPILSIMALSPQVIPTNDRSIQEVLQIIFTPPNSKVGSVILSRDQLPATINSPATNGGVIDVTNYLLFAKIGQFTGTIISYVINAFRDWKTGKKHRVIHDEPPTTKTQAITNPPILPSTQLPYEKVVRRSITHDLDPIEHRDLSNTRLASKDPKASIKKSRRMHRPKELLISEPRQN